MHVVDMIVYDQIGLVNCLILTILKYSNKTHSAGKLYSLQSNKVCINQFTKFVMMSSIQYICSMIHDSNTNSRIQVDVCIKYTYCIADALKESVGLKLVGPYLILAGQLSKSSWEDCVLESRYFYDTPEVQTVLESTNKSGYHIGYFRSANCL